MTTVTLNNFDKSPREYLKSAVVHNDPVTVAMDFGNAVIMSEEEYRSMKETIYLLNCKAMPERFVKAMTTPIEEGEPFEW